jgi:hypothetical protein
MNPWDIIKQLYDSEISASIETDWDDGARVSVVRSFGRAKQVKVFARSEFDEIAAWMDAQACKLFPDSAYAKSRRCT